ERRAHLAQQGGDLPIQSSRGTPPQGGDRVDGQAVLERELRSTRRGPRRLPEAARSRRRNEGERPMSDQTVPAIPEVTDSDVYITRAFNAPIEVVWKFWTEPEGLAQWFGPTTTHVDPATV